MLLDDAWNYRNYIYIYIYIFIIECGDEKGWRLNPE